MQQIITFTNHKSNQKLIAEIKSTAIEQKKYKSKHKYNLNKFSLREKQIKIDCAKYYEIFIN